MKRTLYCERCGEQHIPTLADRYVDDRYLCMMCLKVEGYDPTEGEAIIQTVSMTLTCPVDIRPLRKSGQRGALAGRGATSGSRVVRQHGERAISNPTPRISHLGKVKCAGCEVEFQPRDYRHLYHDTRCRWRAQFRRSHVPEPKPTECYCGKPIVQKNIGQPRQFCSKTCQCRDYTKRLKWARCIPTMVPTGNYVITNIEVPR